MLMLSRFCPAALPQHTAESLRLSVDDIIYSEAAPRSEAEPSILINTSR